MKTKLTLGIGVRSREITIKGTIEGPEYWYPVLGLLPEDQAWIAESRGSWQILRAKNGESYGDWTGDYKSANDALAALQEEVNATLVDPLPA